MAMRARVLGPLAIGLWLVLVPQLRASWEQFASAGYWRDAAAKHPRQHELTMSLSRDGLAGALYCFRYGRISNEPSRGKVRATIEIRRATQRGTLRTVATYKTRKLRVSDDQAYSCGVLGTPLRANDALVVRARFTGMPDLLGNGDSAWFNLRVKSLYESASSVRVSSGLPTAGATVGTLGVGLQVDYVCDQPDDCVVWTYLMNDRGFARGGTSRPVPEGHGTMTSGRIPCQSGQRYDGVLVRIHRLNLSLLNEERVRVPFDCR